MRKGEHAGMQHGIQDLLLFPQCFLKLSFSGLLKHRLVLQRVKKWLSVSQTSPGFYVSAWQVWRNCSKWAFSPFATVFSIYLKNFLPFSSKLKPFQFERVLNLSLGKGLNHFFLAFFSGTLYLHMWQVFYLSETYRICWHWCNKIVQIHCW